MLIVWRILPRSIYKRSRTFKDHFMMDINNEHVLLRTGKRRKRMEMAGFQQICREPFFFHLYFDPRSFFLVPTDAFETNEAKQEARN